MSFDSYYHDQGHLSPAERAAVNYDHPDSLDAELLVSHLVRLSRGLEAAIPIYDFATHTRSGDLRIVEPSDVVLVEGILLFAFASICDQFDYRVFRSCPEDVRFERRLIRDQSERGRSRASVEAQLQATVKPMHDQFVEPFASRADVVTTHGQDLEMLITDLADHVSQLASASA